ncbi:MAG: carboxypeptidase-like regulatory domain-containing protein [Hymenobacter sp.]
MAVYVEVPSVGVATDREGHYALTLPVGRYNVNIRGIGVRSTRRQVWLRGDGRLDLEVAPDAAVLREVVVEGKRSRTCAACRWACSNSISKPSSKCPPCLARPIFCGW